MKCEDCECTKLYCINGTVLCKLSLFRPDEVLICQNCDFRSLPGSLKRQKLFSMLQWTEDIINFVVSAEMGSLPSETKTEKGDEASPIHSLKTES